MEPTTHVLEVWGDLACISRPEMKVERFSYPAVTPSAARGIFDAIYCKPPGFRWEIVKIEVLAKPQYIALRRNEVKEKVNVNEAVRWLTGQAEVRPIFADADRDFTGADTKGRTQRQTMALKNVRYRLHGRIKPWPGRERELPGMEAQFRRRAAQGKCVWQPYFGCREFPAYFELVEPGAVCPAPVEWSQDLGWMLYDVFDLSRPGKNNDAPAISLFAAKVENGVIEVPSYESDAVVKIGEASNA